MVNFSQKMQKFRLGILAFFMVSIGFSCHPSGQLGEEDMVRLEGKTMGTYFGVTYLDAEKRNFQADLEALLQELNAEVSTYIKTSTISVFNQSEKELDLTYDPISKNMEGGKNLHFIENFQIAKSIFENTGGAFDPTVMPLVNYWGFGYTGNKPITVVDSLKIDSLLQYVGFEKVKKLEQPKSLLQKEVVGVQVDFSALAKGYGVDALGKYLEDMGIENYLVDIGGEVRVAGKNGKGKDWSIGINVPKEESALTDLQEVVSVSDMSMATSGNYRNFYEVDGVKYSHTINPKTGFPERNRLLSATVFHKKCAIADGYATAFMVMGIDKAYEMANSMTDIEAYFIYIDQKGDVLKVKYTKGVEQLIGKD